jgi:hypothetical protein
MQISAYSIENLLVTMVLILFFENKQMGKIHFHSSSIENWVNKL